MTQPGTPVIAIVCDRITVYGHDAHLAFHGYVSAVTDVIGADDFFRHDHRLIFVEMENLGHRAGVAGGLADQGVIFEEAAVQGQRP